MKEKLKKDLAKALESLGIHYAGNIPLEHPGDFKNGDYSCNIAMQLFGQAAKASNIEFKDDKNVRSIHTGNFDLSGYKKPRDLADAIAKELGEIPGIGKIEVAGGGFINFYLAWETILQMIEKAYKDDRWGANDTLKDRKIMVEFTDPNPFKEFHIGHLMSNAIGESISRLFELSSAEVKRANYQGDVGPHVAKAIYARTLPSNVGGVPWGVAYKIGNDLYESDPRHKKAVEEINKKIYERDPEIYPLYEKGRQETLAEFELIYEKLGMKPLKKSGNERFFDFYFFESVTAPIGIEIVRSHPEVFTSSDGAIIYRGEDDGLHTRVFITSQETPTYETKELGLAKLKIDTWIFDRSVTITANEQRDYFIVVLAAMRKVLPAIASKIEHVTHGMMRFAEGKMSSRTGNVITALGLLQDLFDVAKERAKESRADDHEKLAHDVALAAVKYQILKQASGKDIIFNRERALSLEGDSGPYLQYAYARALSLLEKGQQAKMVGQMNADTDQDFQEVGALYRLSRKLVIFPDVVERATKEMEPHHVTTYLIELASLFSGWYGTERIIVNGEIMPDRFRLIGAVARTLQNGLRVLGIPAPEKM